MTVQAFLADSVIGFADEWGLLISILLAVGAAIDVIIAVSTLCYLLKQEREGIER